MFNGYIYDIESDGFFFQSTRIWTICLKDLDDPTIKLVLNPFKDKDARQKFIDWHCRYDNPIVAGHYILGFDQFVMMKILGIEFTVGKDTILGKPCIFIDTLYLSQYIDPDADGHSLEAWGQRLGLEKIDFYQASIDAGIIIKGASEGDEFLQHSELMDVYCERDIDVNILLFHNLWKRFCEYYNVENRILPDHFKCGQKSFYLMSCQEFTGWKFDLDYARELASKIEVMMKDIEDNVLPKLPPRKLKKGEMKDYTMPMKPFKKDGTYSSHMLNFITKHNGVIKENNVVEFYGKDYNVESQVMLDVQLPMEIKDSQDLKEWFIEQNWKPTLWNYQRGADGKPMRDQKGKLIQTSPKIQEAGKICPNLESLDGELPKQIVKFLSLRNRLSVLTGWMNNWRLKFDGRIGASRTGITPTQRQKHSVIVNCPKASEKVLLGKEFRSLWIAEKGFKIAAGDAAALEGRVMGHYTWRYDNGETANELLNGDPHSKNAFAFYGDELKNLGFSLTSFDKEDPKFKPFRDKSKNGFYALLYGCSSPKLAGTLGLPESKGDKLLDRFWKANPATASLKENVTKFWETQGQKKWLPAIDGRRLVTRKKSALLNTLFQSCGAIAMDYALCFMDSWLGGIKFDEKKRPHYIYKSKIVRRIGYMHDELEYECEESIAEEVSKMIEKAIEKAGQHLKLSVPLAGEGKIGKNWKEVH